ncbi:hypothetical protein HS088_TW04G00789 [Tripterygium wilfordii]|uniref:DUF7755 domain-containing protein n=1 Tax=Tripterygium wilfordii TaxID=458696 RepID=A0A7J7DRC2_TRIWF|nr:uncharacterized protein LOC119997320 [Tripterygium wilfordii]XP_038700194.1 uncharacterized protein LOC119997329 [Tripterygium wilfordii]KAF5748816.1 hypothetical protein HS088_TW04G00776 [Tripterygium wilfordii]KAF5748829.1 hypothetical protein HS088_TW04G00789 [Tripterygium wilfordii]
METASLSHVVFAGNHRQTNRNPQLFPIHKHVRTRRIHLQCGRFGLGALNFSKQSNFFRDFQGYARPLRLLPVSEAKFCREVIEENIPHTSFSGAEFRWSYKVELQTSSMYGSGLSNLNAGIILCFIDQNGDSILQRIPSASATLYAELEDVVGSDADIIHFQGGSIDSFTFEGPKLGRVDALWVCVESGQWRLGGVSLIIISASQALKEDIDAGKIQYIGFEYKFEVDDLLLGEGSNLSMVELRPCHVSEISGDDPFTLLSRKTISQLTSLDSFSISNEESMKEYADLKSSLLLYDAMLISTGTTIANLSAGDNAAFAFLLGGIGGFLYLLLLQRSVDGLPVPPSDSDRPSGSDQQFGGFKSPLSGIALAVGFTLLAVRYGSGDVSMTLTPKDLLVGMMGFIACKVAVVLAALKPLPLGPKEIK